MAETNTQAAASRLPPRTNLCATALLRATISMGSCRALSAWPSQHFVQTIPACRMVTNLATSRFKHKSPCCLLRFKWIKVESCQDVPGSHCGKFPFEHHGGDKHASSRKQAPSTHELMCHRTAQSNNFDGIMPCIVCMAFTTLRSDHPCMQNGHKLGNLTLQTQVSLAASSDLSGSRWNHAKTYLALIVVNFDLNIMAETNTQAAASRLPPRTNLCATTLLRATISMGSCRALSAWPSQHFVQTIPACRMVTNLATSRFKHKSPLLPPQI